MFDEHVHFTECILIEKKFNPLASSQLALLMLLCDMFLTTHVVNKGRPFLQVIVLLNSFTHNASITRMQDLIGTIRYAGQKEVHLF
jgi:hypothetical protein